VYDRSAELFAAARAQFTFWGLRPEHRLALLCSTRSFRPTVEAYYAAAHSFGARPALITIPHLEPYTDIPPFVEDALLAADFVVDLQHLNWGYTRSNGRVIGTLNRAGAFYTQVGGMEEDVDTIIANPPTEEKRARAKKAQALIDGASRVRVTAATGTDFVVERGDPARFPSYTSNRFGNVAFAPVAGSATGTVALTGVVRIQAPVLEKFPVRAPLRIRLERGRIAEIDRSTGEGTYLDSWFRSFGRDDAWNVAHLNVGLIPLPVVNIDNDAIRFAYGGVLLGFGVNGDIHFGTALSDVPNHIDLHHARVSYFVDDLALLRDGRFTPESGLTLTPEEQRMADRL
jgi:hypothetical protein